MLLKDFIFLTYENIHPESINYLRNNSFDIKDVREENLTGSSDLLLMNLALKDNRVIITQDKDFGKLVYTKKSDFIGIFYIRPGHILPQFHIDTINHLLRSDIHLESSFILIAENIGNSIKIRIRNNIII